MLDRILFALRNWGPDVGRWLGSWRLSIVLMILAVLYYGLLAIWSTSSPPAMVQNIASLLPFWLLYALLLLNTLVCLWTRFGLLRHQVSSRPYLTQGPHDWEIEASPDVHEASKLFRDRGYEPRREGERGLWAVRRRWSAVGTYLFHGAFALLALGFLLTLLGRQVANIWVAVGEEFSGQPEQFLSQSPPRLFSPGLPPVSFRVESIGPEFWRDQLLFTNLDADLVLPGGGRTKTRINRPLWWNWSTFVRLSGFGYAPRYQIEDRTGAVIDSAFVKLNVFPPGQRDFFQVPDFPHRFYVGVMPDFVESDGQPATDSLNLVNPGVLLHVWRGRIDLRSTTLLEEDGFDFEDLTIRFPEIHYWGQFSIVQDPGAPVIFLGYLMGVAGLLLKLRGRRTEMTWHADDQDRGWLRGWGSSEPGRAATR